jgi:hypothetical protein
MRAGGRAASQSGAAHADGPAGSAAAGEQAVARISNCMRSRWQPAPLTLSADLQQVVAQDLAGLVKQLLGSGHLGNQLLQRAARVSDGLAWWWRMCNAPARVYWLRRCR